MCLRVSEKTKQKQNSNEIRVPVTYLTIITFNHNNHKNREIK